MISSHLRPRPTSSEPLAPSLWTRSASCGEAAIGEGIAAVRDKLFDADTHMGRFAERKATPLRRGAKPIGCARKPDDPTAPPSRLLATSVTVGDARRHHAGAHPRQIA
jgi:hypothetical protein